MSRFRQFFGAFWYAARWPHFARMLFIILSGLFLAGGGAILLTRPYLPDKPERLGFDAVMNLLGESSPRYVEFEAGLDFSKKIYDTGWVPYWGHCPPAEIHPLPPREAPSSAFEKLVGCRVTLTGPLKPAGRLAGGQSGAEGRIVHHPRRQRSLLRRKIARAAQLVLLGAGRRKPPIHVRPGNPRAGEELHGFHRRGAAAARAVGPEDEEQGLRPLQRRDRAAVARALRSRPVPDSEGIQRRRDRGRLALCAVRRADRRRRACGARRVHRGRRAAPRRRA